jgi:hypothetical protein
MCPAAPVTATLMGVFMAQLAINTLARARDSSTSLGMTGIKLPVDFECHVSEQAGQNH